MYEPMKTRDQVDERQTLLAKGDLTSVAGGLVQCMDGITSSERVIKFLNKVFRGKQVQRSIVGVSVTLIDSFTGSSCSGAVGSRGGKRRFVIEVRHNPRVRGGERTIELKL